MVALFMVKVVVIVLDDVSVVVLVEAFVVIPETKSM